MKITDLVNSVHALQVALDQLPSTSKGTPDQNQKVQRCADEVLLLMSHPELDWSKMSAKEADSIYAAGKKFQERYGQIQQGGGFNRLLFKSQTEKSCEAAKAVLGPLLSKLDLKAIRVDLMQHSMRPFSHADKPSLRKKCEEYPMHLLLLDHDFAFGFAKKCAKNYPEILLDDPDLWATFLSRDELLRVGGRLEDVGQQKRYCELFKLSSDALKKSRWEYLKNLQKVIQNAMGRGICLGYALAYLSPFFSGFSHAEIASAARFIQADHNLVTGSLGYNPAYLTAIGRELVQRRHEFPLFLQTIKNILGEGQEENYYLLGRVAFESGRKRFEQHFEELEELEAEQVDEFDHQAHTNHLQKLDWYQKLGNELKDFKELCRRQSQPKYLDQADQTPALMARLGLKVEKPLFDEACPLAQLPEKLSSLVSKITRFKLDLGSEDSGHTIECSFFPPYFRDQNNVDESTLEPRKHSFSTPQEMIERLELHMGYIYPKGCFAQFNVTPIKEALS